MEGNPTSDRRGLSPVIGTVLMVAVVVLLAVIIGSLALGLSDRVVEPAPTAAFDGDYNESSNPALTVTHAGGDGISAEHLVIHFTNRNGDEVSANWPNAETVSVGDSVAFTPEPGSTVKLTWEKDSRGAVVWEYDVPN